LRPIIYVLSIVIKDKQEVLQVFIEVSEELELTEAQLDLEGLHVNVGWQVGLKTGLFYEVFIVDSNAAWLEELLSWDFIRVVMLIIFNGIF
jgi:hypothetical protein